MHALLRANVRRRIVSLAVFAVLAVTTPVLLASACPAAAAGTVSVVIDSMNPSWARLGATVKLTGTVTNGTGQARSGVEVQLFTSPATFHTRDEMDSYLTHGGAPEAAGQPFVIGTTLRPGATARWSASFRVDDAGITQFGVYPVTAQAADAVDGVLASGRTLLPFWPGMQAAGLARQLDIAWIWPLADRPYHQACSALTGNALAASLGAGGRLSALLDVAKAHPEAELTWFVDPALLSDVATMTAPYKVGSRPNCLGSAHEPASRAAAQWLAGLRATLGSAPRQQVVLAPYANVDMTALVHHGLNSDLATAYALGDAVAAQVLPGMPRPSIAWPSGGTADLSVLTNLAATEKIGTVVLSSGQMPSAPGPPYHGEDAVTSVRTGAGTTMNVLLADDTLTRVLRAGNGTPPRGTQFAVRQRFLAETAMIAAEEPNSERSIVVAPPQDWSPTAALAGDLLAETAGTPWLMPATLSDLTTAQDTERAISRQPPPASKDSPGELGRAYLGQVSKAGTGLGVYKSVLYRPRASYLQHLNEALAATESAAWRGSGDAQGTALTNGLLGYLRNAEKKIKIIASAQVPMGGASGAVPVSIQNGLPDQAIQVRLTTSVVTTPGRTSQLTVGRFPDLRVVQPQQAITVRLPVSSAPQGSTLINLGLATADGKPLPVTSRLTVESTRYGRAILFLIAAAIGVLVLTSLYRAARRWLNDDAHAAVQEAEPPGSVVTGTSGARHPTEAQDDLADARRRADDT